MNNKRLDKAARSLLSMGLGTRKRPSKPTKKDLQRKFKMSIDRKAKPSIQEVE